MNAQIGGVMATTEELCESHLRVRADVVHLGQATRRRRRELRLTQQQLADLAEVSVRFVHDLERGKATVQLVQVLLTLQALGLRLVLRRGTGALEVVDA